MGMEQLSEQTKPTQQVMMELPFSHFNLRLSILSETPNPTKKSKKPLIKMMKERKILYLIMIHHQKNTRMTKNKEKKLKIIFLRSQSKKKTKESLDLQMTHLINSKKMLVLFCLKKVSLLNKRKIFYHLKIQKTMKSAIT